MIKSFCVSLIAISALLTSLNAAAVEYRLPAKESRLIGENQYYVVPEGKLT